jgi:hypothetical protein
MPVKQEPVDVCLDLEAGVRAATASRPSRAAIRMKLYIVFAGQFSLSFSVAAVCMGTLGARLWFQRNTVMSLAVFLFLLLVPAPGKICWIIRHNFHD